MCVQGHISIKNISKSKSVPLASVGPSLDLKDGPDENNSHFQVDSFVSKGIGLNYLLNNNTYK